ncbi:hypothetical protein [Crocosphaera chwakensis]|uniref:Uncharacterized protein n=1 Tax=Crocosphaera chwakensis CCY0110 TaxID=391612 RepID=A3IL00_9CHRO|nr:hypothetical protein [Crocosphaera chwakensis]EAZ92869.1 hypothetical protein CY0110_22272 [Crocosphaera chwakensis CCY0110]
MNNFPFFYRLLLILSSLALIKGPFADEYKFAHEVKVADETGEHKLNFSGGLLEVANF